MNVDVVRQRLLEGDAETVHKELLELNRRADVLHTPQLPRILDALFPVWKTLLHSKLPPQQRATQANRCRKLLLQILNRLPSNDALRPYVPQLLHLLMEVLYRDNEDNALLALKTVFDLHRNYRPGLRSEVQAFLDLVQQMYKNVNVTMRKQFVEAPTPTIPTASTPATTTVAVVTPVSVTAITSVPATATATATVADAVQDLTKAAAVTATPVASVTATNGIKTEGPSIVASATTSTTTTTAAGATVASVVPPTPGATGGDVKPETAANSTSAVTPVASVAPLAATATATVPATPVAGAAAAGSTAPASVPATPTPVPVPAIEESLRSSMESFKAISELPLIIMLLFQCYPSYIETHVPVLVPLMMNLLALRAPEHAARVHPQRYVDFLDCQVKTLSFVTYLLRGCAAMMRPFQDAICENTVKLLTVCPKDAFVLRKDIFVAARHIISTDFRRGFYAQLELLMDDDVLIGKGRCSFHQIRPLAYSTLADMIHHVRDMLTLAQVSRIVDFYGKRIHDATLPISIQTTSIRLLLNLVDISAKNDDADGWKGRNILSRILLIIANKFGSTLASLPIALGMGLRATRAAGSTTSDLLDGGAMDKIKQSTLLPKAVLDKSPQEKKLEALLLPYLNAASRCATSGGVDVFTAEEEPCIRDVKSLLRTMILGVRAVIWCTANYRNPHAKDLTSMDAAASASSSSSYGDVAAGLSASTGGALADGTTSSHAFPLTDDERKLISRVLQNGLRCFILYTLSENTLAEEKQMLDHFAGAFTVLDAPDFRDLFIANMDLLYESILQDHAILTIPQHFLANSNVSCWFAEILLKFLIAQMKDLSVAAEGDVPDMKRDDKVLEITSLRFEKMREVRLEHRASIVLRLFKIVFGSVTLFKSNESALFPHLRTIIESCLKEATFTRHPDNYLLLLRALFRSISGGKYENFYKEVFPLLPGILSALMRLQKHIQKPSMQEVLLELCLTIPARLSSLLQYLPSLMKSVVQAILSRGELAYLGLRTLEFWVDNLNPDFLYPIMTSQERLLTEIIEALNTHLLPPPYPYGELSMRILGKIGGRNRQYLMDPLELTFREPQRQALVIEFAGWVEPLDDENDASANPATAGTAPTSTTLRLQMDVVLARVAVILHRYHRKSVHDWEHLVKTDARMSDTDEYDDHGHGNGAGSNNANLANGSTTDASVASVASGGAAASSSSSSSSSLLLEKDDKTLELETESALKVKQSILQYKTYAFDVLVKLAAIAMRLVDKEEDNAMDGRGDDEDEDDENEDEDDDGDDAEDDPMDGVASGSSSATTSAAVQWESELPARQLLLRTLFETVDDVDFGEQAAQLLERAATQLTKAVLEICDRQEPNFAALSTLQPSSLLPGNRGLSPGRHLATAKRIEVLRQASYGTPVLLRMQDRRRPAGLALFQAFAGATLEGLSSPNGQVVEGAKRVLQRVIETTLTYFDVENDAAAAAYKGGALFHTLCDVFAHACYDKSSWRVKLGGVTGLRLLVESVAAPFCHENELVIVKALFFVLSDHPSEVSATVSVETGDALLAVVDKARDVRALDIETFSSGAIKREDFMSCTAFQETEIFQMFVVEFLSPKAPSRRYARKCIARVAAFMDTTESAMLFPYQQLISKQITGCALRSLAVGTRIGYVDAMAHALSIKPSIFPLTKDLMTFLQDVWRLISEDGPGVAGESSSQGSSTPSSSGGGSNSSGSSNGNNSNGNCPVSAQEYPFGLSQGCELRIAAVKLFRAAFLAAPDEMNQHHEARNRFVGVFFRYLTRQPLELVTCAQLALSDVIQLNKQQKEITLPKELLQQCLRPVLLNLADYRKLNLPLLDGLSRLLTLLSSCFNVTLGEKLLEHLKQWRDPERIMKAGIWKRGDEPAVAAAIIDLFHLLPPNESFLESLVDCVVELEAVLPLYGSYGKMSSPYRLPLTRFLNRYAKSSLAFFLKREHLIESKYSSLFQELVKLPEASPLRDLILTDGGAESLMTATFVAASKASVVAAASESNAAATAAAGATAAVGAGAAVSSVGTDATATDDVKMQAQIQLNAQKAAAQAVANAQAQGLSPGAAEARGMQARAAYVAKATAQVNAQQALKVQSQVQIQANAQKLHAQTLAAAQAQGLSLVQAQAKAQFASKDYIAKAQSQVAASTALPSPISALTSTVSATPSPSVSPHQVTQLQAQQLNAQIQVNAQKVHAQALAAAHAQGLKPIQAQEKAKQAQATYVHRAKAQAQAKLARQSLVTGALSSSTTTTPAASPSAASAVSALPSSSSSAVLPFSSKAHQEALELLYQGLRLVRTVSKLHPTWLASQPVLVDCLRKLWRSPARAQRLLAQERLQIRYHYESKLLVKILVSYCRAKQDDVQVLLELVSAFLHRSSSFDFSGLQHFYQHDVAHTYAASHKRTIVHLFLRMLRDSASSDELKVHAMQLLIMPMLTASFEDPAVNNADVMDADTVQWMLREILASKDAVTASSGSGAVAVGSASSAVTVVHPPGDAMITLRIELLKLGTLLIQHMSKFVTEHRKEVIKFAWNHLKAHDLTSKLWAYVNVCRFISVYDTPPKIVLQVYVALLRTYEMDARFLVRKAFDILLPALPSRLPPNEFIKAIKWTKKIAYEEGHSLGQLVHIWFLIVRHPALFYPFRGQFVPLMVNSLNRLAIPPSSTPDNRRLAVNIVDLIVAWEQTRRERVAARPAITSADGGVEDPLADGGAAGLKRRATDEQGDGASEAKVEESEVPDQKRRKVLLTTSEASNGENAASAVGVGSTSTTRAAAPSSSGDGSGVPPSPTDSVSKGQYSEDDFELNAPMVDLVINFTFRFALASADKQETSRLSKTCGELFDKALHLWPSAVVRFSYFDKLIAVTAEAIIRLQQQQQLHAAAAAAAAAGGNGTALAPPPPPPATTMPTFFSVPKGAPLFSLAILDAVLGILNSLITPEVVANSTRSIPYVVQYAPRVMKLLEPCFDRRNTEIQAGLTTFLKRMIELYPPNRASPELVACKFYPWLKEILEERLQSAAFLQQEFLTSLPAHASGSGAASSTAVQKAKAKQNAAAAAAAAAANATAAQSTTATVKTEPKTNTTVGSPALSSVNGAKRQKVAAGDASSSTAAASASAASNAALKAKMVALSRSGNVTPSMFAGETTLRLLAALCEGAPGFADAFAPSLLKLAQFFTREHLLQSAAAASATTSAASSSSSRGALSVGGGGVSTPAMSQDTSSSLTSDSMTRHRVMATPSLAITEEWHHMLSGRSTLAVNNVIRHLKKKEPVEKPTKKKQNADKDASGSTKSGGASAGKKKSGGAAAASAASSASSLSSSLSSGGGTGSGAASSASAAASGLMTHKLAVDMLIVSLDLLSKCTLASGDHRRVYTNLLVHCLESSTNIPLLLQITRIVGQSITAPHATHSNMLAAKDKMTLLTKMTMFDRLPEVAALPLWDEYYQLILKLCDPTSDVKHSYFHINPAISQSHSLTTHFLAGLMAPDPAIREQFLKYFYDAAPAVGVCGGDGGAAEALTLPTARLLLVLRQDWQACGSRYWLAVATETLLSAASSVVPGSSNTSSSAATMISAGSSSIQAKRRRSSTALTVPLFQSLRYLAHIDVELADDLYVQLFSDTWQRLVPLHQTQVTTQLLKMLSSKFNKRDLHVPLLQGASPPRGRVNVVQTLLKSLVTVSPSAPVLTPELVVHLASNYDVWSAAARMCEFQVENASLSVESRLRWIEALSSIYKALQEDDLRVGLSLEHIAQPETRSALVLEALGCVHEAQEEYFKALSKAQSGRVSMDDVNLFELRLWEERWVACAKQLCQWQLMHDFAKATQNQDLLLDCVWKRGDWNGAKHLLNVSLGGSASYGGGSGSSALLTGSVAQGGSTSGTGHDLAGACPHTRLQRLYIALLDSEKRVSIDTLAAQTAELALIQWQGLPRVLGKSHVALLHLFHQFVEVKESIQMMSDIKHASQLHTLPNLKPSINTWRERLPNKWEPILLWDDILTWRSHMFQVVKTTFSWSDAQMLACMHDSPWSVIRLAHTARKQHLPDVCLGALSKLYAIPAMDVQDAFSKLREQVSICYESSSEYTGGLAILNNTNLDYFSLRQKAEMFRLKALFLEAMGSSAEANRTFSYCLQICDSYGKGWLSWGHYCYRLFLASTARGGGGSSGSGTHRDLSFASQTIACYLQAIHHRCNAARLMIARVLWLLSQDDHQRVLIQSFEAHGKQLPIWIWIVWIPQLLMALGRPEAPQIRGLLRGLSAKFPQALYYTMRAFFLENRDSAMLTMGAGGDNRQNSSAPSTPSSMSASTGTPTNGGGGGGPGTPTYGSQNAVYYRTKAGVVVAVPAAMPLSQVQQIPGLVAPARPTPTAFGVALSQVLSVEAWRERLVGNNGNGIGSSDAPASGAPGSGVTVAKPELGPVQYTEDLLNFLRRTHDSLTFEMECVLEEMITKFRPEPEEELLTAVHSLLLKCYQLPRLSQRELVPRMLRAALEKVCRKLFAVVPPSASTQPQSQQLQQPPQKNEKYLEFVSEFKSAFEADFAPPMAMGEPLVETVTLFEMMDRLKKWRNLLQARVQNQSQSHSSYYSGGNHGYNTSSTTARSSSSSTTTLRLEHCSRFLMELSSSNMEVPGQYISDSEPIKDLHARILYFDNDVDVLLRSGYTQRRLAMGGSDGRTYSFLVQYAMTHTTRTDERMAQMYLLLNRLLLRHKETKKRNAVFHVPKIIPLTPRVRLLEDSRDFVTLGEIYDQQCRATRQDPDFPIELFRTRISEAYDASQTKGQSDGYGHDHDHDALSPQQEDEQLALARASAFDEICSTHVPETLLSKFVFQLSAHADAYFQFRSEFTKHLALSSLLSYVLFVGDRAPHRVLFSKRTARVVSAELRPGYATSGLLEASTSMPFRLTRNLHNFVTRPGVHGPFSVAMAATAEALLGEEDLLGNQLGLFFRDDLLSWHASKSRLTTNATATTGTGPLDSPAMASSSSQQQLQQQQQQQRQRRLESQVQQRVDANVSLVLERIRGVSLKKETDSQRGKSVRELLEIATSPERQREMYPTWCPWL